MHLFIYTRNHQTHPEEVDSISSSSNDFAIAEGLTSGRNGSNGQNGHAAVTIINATASNDETAFDDTEGARKAIQVYYSISEGTFPV